MNSKNGAVVTRLRDGEGVTKDEVLEFVADLAERPVAVIAGILHGSGERIAPCPVCRAEGSSLAVMNKKGKCYRCGDVSVAMLYATVMANPTVEAPNAST